MIIDDGRKRRRCERTRCSAVIHKELRELPLTSKAGVKIDGSGTSVIGSRATTRRHCSQELISDVIKYDTSTAAPAADQRVRRPAVNGDGSGSQNLRGVQVNGPTGTAAAANSRTGNAISRDFSVELQCPVDRDPQVTSPVSAEDTKLARATAATAARGTGCSKERSRENDAAQLVRIAAT